LTNLIYIFDTQHEQSEAMAGTTFHFVDTTQTSRAAKKLARSHVMKGKNAGKRFHRRSRLQPAPPMLNAGERTLILRRDLDKSQKEYHYSDEEHAELNSIMDCPSNAILTGLPVEIANPSMEVMNECEVSHP
jgi:hypothetical protein